MNERMTKIVIDLLGKEGVVNSRAFGHWALSDEELEKFAELIVRECIKMVENEAAQYVEPVWAVELVNDMHEHFGVEE